MGVASAFCHAVQCWHFFRVETPTMDSLRQRFGRPLRLAVIGGGPDSWIGRMHRGAAEFDGWWRVCAGVFSSDAARSRVAGPLLGVDAHRSYGDIAELLAAEAQRPDGVDAVAIMTPNDTHYRYAAAALDAGLDVLCDKPVTETHAQALDLVARTNAKGRLFAIAHGYSAYPMVRQARRLVNEGAIGPVRLVQVEYIQSGLATRVEDGALTNRLRWILDPDRSGQALVMSAIGCHAQHLACFTAGLRVARVAADAGALVPGRRVIDHVSALLEFDNGARGTFTATQAAAGAENDIALRIYGERGMLEWRHRSSSYLSLALQGEPAQTMGRGNSYLSPEIIAAGRTPYGHPEGLREAFANVYGELARERMARTLGEAVPQAPYPRIEDGAHTMAFIEACLASSARRGWADVAR
jgi:predicted dehydrogenase